MSSSTAAPTTMNTKQSSRALGPTRRVLPYRPFALDGTSGMYGTNDPLSSHQHSPSPGRSRLPPTLADPCNRHTDGTNGTKCVYRFTTYCNREMKHTVGGIPKLLYFSISKAFLFCAICRALATQYTLSSRRRDTTPPRRFFSLNFVLLAPPPLPQLPPQLPRK